MKRWNKHTLPIHQYVFFLQVFHHCTYDKSICCSIYKNAAAVMILYDISKHTSFQDAVGDWLEEVKGAGLYHPVILLVGHKYDKRPIRSVTTSEAQDFAG